MTLEKYAFTMKLHLGMEAEYKRRHDTIWPELSQLLHDAGVSDYTIHLDEQTGMLFGLLSRRADHTMGSLPQHPIMKRWWAYMADIMDTNPDGSPVQCTLKPVFHLP
jgi:L-rhamnose mutarotase